MGLLDKLAKKFDVLKKETARYVCPNCVHPLFYFAEGSLFYCGHCHDAFPSALIARLHGE